MNRGIRIIVVGWSAEAGLRDSLVSAFRSNGCSVDVIELGPWKPPWLVSAAFRQPRLGAGFRNAFRRQVDSAAERGPADLVVVFKGSLLNSRSVGHLRSRLGCPVICWNPDSPFDGAISNCGAGIPQTVAAYDAYITWADDVADLLRPLAARVIVLPFAWDPRIMRPTEGDGVAKDRIVFVGTGTRERCAALAQISSLRPMAFGTGWPNVEGVDVRPPVRGLAFCKVVGEAKWNLNLLRPQNAKSHNMRTFELVGAGGTQVTAATDDHQRFLGADGQTVLFESARQLRSILLSDPADRPPRPEESLCGHTYADRADQLLAELRLL